MTDNKQANGKADHTAKPITRRALIAGAAGLAGAAAMPRIAEPATRQQVPQDPTKVPGARAAAVGERSPFERPERVVSNSPGGVSRTPLQDLDGIITPADLHFERHHAGIPQIDPERYRLVIHGMVDRPTTYTLEDLRRFPQRSRIHFLECSGNGGGGYRTDPAPERTPQDVDGLTSASEWIGVPLATLFREVGIQDGATWFLAEGMDAAVMTRSIPVEKAFDDAMIALGQNGEPLRPAQGYPARLFLPGWEGNASVKWIRRIELSNRPFMTREETAKYSDPLKDGTARIFSFDMDAKSVITAPVYPTVLSGPGWWEIRGTAWSGRGVIARVEVSTNGGDTWELAELDEPVLPKCHTRFRHMWNWDGSSTVIMSRAHDDTGYVQPTTQQLQDARGVATHYHYNSIRRWTVGTDGSVVFGDQR